MIIIAAFTCLWCLPFTARARKAHTHYCSSCGTRIASKDSGRAPVLPAHVRDVNHGITTKPLTIQPSNLPLSPLGAFRLASPDQSPTYEQYTIEGPASRTSEGIFTIRGNLLSDATENAYINIAVKPLPPWTDSMQNAQSHYCKIIEAWREQDKDHRVPDIQLLSSGKSTLRTVPLLSARVQRPVISPLDEHDQVNANYRWKFSVQTTRHVQNDSILLNQFTFVSPDSLLGHMSEESIEWKTASGPVFWEVESRDALRLVDAFGRLVATYRIVDKRKVQVTAATILEDTTLHEVLFVIILVLLERDKYRQWSVGQIRHD